MKLGQEDDEFKASLHYIVSLRLALATQKDTAQQTTKNVPQDLIIHNEWTERAVSEDKTMKEQNGHCREENEWKWRLPWRYLAVAWRWRKDK